MSDNYKVSEIVFCKLIFYFTTVEIILIYFLFFINITIMAAKKKAKKATKKVAKKKVAKKKTAKKTAKKKSSRRRR